MVRVPIEVDLFMEIFTIKYGDADNEFIRWLDQNGIPMPDMQPENTGNRMVLYFKDADFAVLFKLRWL